MVKHLKEIQRKTLHILAGTLLILGCTWINNTYNQHTLTFALIILTTLSLFVDYLLAQNHTSISLYTKLQRPQEKNNIHHHTYALISITLISTITTPTILLTTAAIITYGDAAAALIGTYFGKHKLLGKKTLEGSIAMFATSLFASTLILGPTLPALGTAIAATTAEATSHNINDALTIPLAAGLTATLLTTFF